MFDIQPVDETEGEVLFEMVQRYWAELMPHAPVVQDPSIRPAYFADEFRLGRPGHCLWWAMVNDERIGFASVEVNRDWADQPWAFVNDFYIEPAWRRQGHGRTLARTVIEWLKEQGITRIDLHVRRDNPRALAFWQSIGFDLASYRMRMYV